MKRYFLAIIFLFLITAAASAGERRYTPDWDSLDARPIPQWYDEAKFGIFIHWGVYSVPSYAPGAEWYIHSLLDGDSAGALTLLSKYAKKMESETSKFHARMYGNDFKYEDFAPMFKAEFFDPEKWADLFKQSGARYVVLTAKHHDGYCLWPAPDSENWNSFDTGPKRDLAGELSTAVKNAGLKMGFYYSHLEWYHSLYVKDINRYVDEHLIPQIKDLVLKYEPSLLWGDGEWDYSSSVLKTREFLSWIYNDSPVRDEMVINDRWGQDTRSAHGGFFTSEMGAGMLFRKIDFSRKWEECNTIAGSWGHVRNLDLSSVSSPEKLIHTLIDVVSRGGNFLLNVGPTSDGRIPLIQQERLLQIGEWLNVNGEAIYGTKKWRVYADGEFIRYTAKDGAVYAISLKWPGDALALNAPEPDEAMKVTMLGLNNELHWKRENGNIVITVPRLTIAEIPCLYAYVFKLEGVK